MSNKQAAWQNEAIMAALSEWWGEVSPTGTARAALLPDLYQSYYEYMLRPTRWEFRLNYDQFAKCLMAAGILHLGGGVWRQTSEWRPRADQIRRVTGYVGL